MTLERTQAISCRNTYTPSHIVCYTPSSEFSFRFFFWRGARSASQDSSSSPPLSISSSSLTTPTTPAPFFSFNTLPASESLDANAFRAPRFAPTSQICSLALDPAAAIVSGSSGEKTAENTFPYCLREMMRDQDTNRTYNVQISRCDHAHRRLAAFGLVHVPDLDALVCASGHEASAHKRTHVQSGHSTVVGGNREPRGRRSLEIRWQRPSIEIEHETVFQRDLRPRERDAFALGEWLT